MSSRPIVSSLLLAAILATQPPHPLVGTWEISVPTMIRGDNGPTSVVLSGRLTVDATADSLVASVAMNAIPGQPAPQAIRVAGVRRDGMVRLAASSSATLSGANGDMSREAKTTYVLDARNDQLSGEILIEVEGVPGIPPRQITGRRVVP
jgi:hypothetical protein